MAERRYDDDELTRILKKAAEEQAEGQDPNAQSKGYSLDDIERVAAEIGIDPRYVQSAAQSLPVDPPEIPKFSFWGGRPRRTIERTIDGEFDDAAWEEAVSELRRSYNSAGTIANMGTSREWEGGSDFTSIFLSATPKNGKTRLRIAVQQDGTIAVSWIVAFLACFLGTIAIAVFLKQTHTPGPGLLYVLPYYLAILALTNRLVSRWSRAGLARVEESVNRLARLTKPGESKNRMRERLGQKKAKSESVEESLEQ
ncbi:MAG: hypothetical protein GC165_02590 [Armatimonadetes bacterium]|nr:hypothetical protein [Armatimonadota bacterium]